jgi:hypothetical protein
MQQQEKWVTTKAAGRELNNPIEESRCFFKQLQFFLLTLPY